jgi:hypothetical protein
MSETWSVTVAVTRPDGSVEHVRVGTATRAGEGFSLSLNPMSISPAGSAPVRAAAPRAASYSSGGGSYGGGGGGGGGEVFPNYGRSKGMPIAGASMQDLEFYANGSRRSLSDPGKSRFHDKERQLLAAIEGEMARQRGGGSGGGDAPSDDGIPPPGDEDAPF